MRLQPFALIIGLAVSASTSGCFQDGDVTDDWQDADLRVSSHDAEPVAGNPAGLGAIFELAQTRHNVLLKVIFRTTGPGYMILEEDGGGDVHGEHVDEASTVVNPQWARLDSMEAGGNPIAVVHAQPGAPPGEFALGLYWDSG
jgi:hypothetical protein